MWLKENRFLLVSKLYQIMFWNDFDNSIPDSEITEIPLLEDFIYPEGWDNFINEKTAKLKELDSEFTLFLKKKLNQPEKTFLLVKAILAAGFIEHTELGAEKFKELKLADLYSKLTQDVTGGQSPELVYSIFKNIET
jgi:hypothetical protein